jgi:hypothetical protein
MSGHKRSFLREAEFKRPDNLPIMTVRGLAQSPGGGGGGWDFVAALEIATPRLRQSLAALGFGYGLNEKPFNEAR